MATAVTMFPAPGVAFGGPIGPCPSGATYQPNPVTGAITGVAAADILQLQAAGFNTVTLGNAAITLSGGKNSDGTVIDATGAAAKFKIVSTPGTTLNIRGNDAKNATITSDVLYEVPLPPSYQNGAGISVTANAIIEGTGTPGTKTLDVLVYKISNAGVQGADLGPAAQNMDTIAGDLTFLVPGTGLAAGDRLLLDFKAILQETGNVNNINARINSIRLA